ncbi:MAG: hypothetical protein ACXAE3_11040 [Candidatus Kariarchaeaceae archaeon]|jgi:hypothetical protein
MRYLLWLFLILLIITPVAADDHLEEDESGEHLGTLAIFFLILGSPYIMLRRLLVYSRRLDDSNGEFKEHVRRMYHNIRSNMLRLHNYSMLVATGVGLVHGLLLINRELGDTIFGILTLLAMILLSLSGILMYYRFRPVWDNRSARGFTKFLHRQWLLTIIMSITLILHIA